MDYLDVNGDGKLDAREMAVGQQMAAMMLGLSWEDCDLDGDGSVSAGEWSAAANEAMQALMADASEESETAETALAEALPLSLVLDRLSQDDRYTSEIAELREAVEDLDDEEAVYTHIYGNPSRYVYLGPAVRTWWRHYPVKGAKWRYGHRYGRHRVGPKVKPGANPKPGGRVGPPKKAAAGGPKKPGKSGKGPGPKGGKRGGGRR
jgi:hypothetical protein